MRKSREFNVLSGLTLAKVERGDCDLDHDEDGLRFTTTCGRVFEMYHCQDCCESVEIEDIDGDLNSLVDAYVLSAYESSNYLDSGDGDEKWTFYRLNTSKGGLCIRWYGESSGYYSVSVSFKEVSDD